MGAKRSTAAGSNAFGTQSVERTLHLLRAIATRGHFGWRLTDLIAHCGMSRSTAHRLLTCLVRERLLSFRPSNRHYVLGPLLFELSLSLPEHYPDFVRACHEPMSRITRQFGGVTYLIVRSHADAVCVARVGVPSLKGMTVEVGTRKPLMSTVGGIAILIALGADERRRIVEQNRKDMRQHEMPRFDSLEKVLRDSLRQGFAVNHGVIVPDINAVGFAVNDPIGEPFAALVASGSANDFPASRTKQIMTKLSEEGAQIARAADLLSKVSTQPLVTGL